MTPHPTVILTPLKQQHSPEVPLHSFRLPPETTSFTQNTAKLILTSPKATPFIQNTPTLILTSFKTTPFIWSTPPPPHTLILTSPQNNIHARYPTLILTNAKTTSLIQNTPPPPLILTSLKTTVTWSTPHSFWLPPKRHHSFKIL